jgi:alanine racemase
MFPDASQLAKDADHRYELPMQNDDPIPYPDFENAPSRLIIDLAALVENWRLMDRLSGKARASAVVKANAYGLGIIEVGTALYNAGCRDFFVAQAREGAQLRRVAPEARIFVLSGVWPGAEDLFFSHDLVPILASEEQLAFWMALAAEGVDHPCGLQIDTGMNRLGLSVEDALLLADDPSRPTAFSPVLVMSHPSCGDEPAHDMNRLQLARFRQVVSAYDGIEASLCNSALVHLGADYHFDLTRPGIALYGGAAVNHVPNPMQTVVTAEARIVQIRDAKAGEPVSYGATHICKRDSRLAIVGAGYADGWLRSLSGSGVPLRQTGLSGAMGAFEHYRVPLVGRVTMDMVTFDISDIPENTIKTGDYIELFGNAISVDDAAKSAGTISWELLTSLGERCSRLYLD